MNRGVALLVAFVVYAPLIAGCSRQTTTATSPVTGPSPTTPTPPTPISPAVTQLVITGLPAPLVFDVPSSLKAGQSYVLDATATLSDGSVAPLKAGALTWTTDNPAVASFDGNTLQARQEGTLRITLRLIYGDVVVSRDVTVRSSAEIIREERADRVDCGTPRVCPYPFCPRVGPYWLFPVHESGTIELIDVQNHGWGSPSNYVHQLSPKGESLKSWLLLKNNKERRTGTVPGGYLYVFTMDADLGPCGDVSAVWTHPG